MVPIRSAEVLVDRRWLYADLYAWQRTPSGGWRGLVSYTVGIGEKYLDHIDADRLRPYPAPDPEDDTG